MPNPGLKHSRSARLDPAEDRCDSAAHDQSFTESYLPYLLAQASAIACDQFAQPLRASGLSPVAWRLLATLIDGGGMTVGQLSRIVLTQQPRATQVITQLEAEGLLVREQGTKDRRQIIVYITDQGRKRIAELLVTAKENEQLVSKSLSPEELCELKTILMKIIKNSWVEKLDSYSYG